MYVKFLSSENDRIVQLPLDEPCVLEDYEFTYTGDPDTCVELSVHNRKTRLSLTTRICRALTSDSNEPMFVVSPSLVSSMIAATQNNGK